MQRFESFYSRLWTLDWLCREWADDYKGSGWLLSLSPTCNKPKNKCDLKPQGFFLFFSFSNNYHDVHKQICISHEIVVNLGHAYLLPLNFRRAKLSCCPWTSISPSISITKPNRKPRLAISRVYIAYWNIMKIQPKGGQRKLRFLRE